MASAVTFPLSLAQVFDLLYLTEGELELEDNRDRSGLESGEILSSDTKPNLWSGQFSTRPMAHSEAKGIAARLRTLDGASGTLLMADPKRLYPTADPDGSVFGSSTPTISAVNADNKRISITGLPNGYVLSAGDRWSALYDTTRRYYGEFSFGGTADGSGDLADIEVRPHLPPGFADSVSIELIKPSIKAKLLDRPEVPQQNLVHSRVVFSVRQTRGA